MQQIDIKDSEFWEVLEQEPLQLFDLALDAGYIAIYICLYQRKQGGFVICLNKYHKEFSAFEYYKSENWVDMVDSIEVIKSIGMKWMGKELCN